MSNQLSDLNTHLFEQLARLSNKDLSPEDIENEAVRTKAIVHLANTVIDNASLTLKACELVAAHGDHFINRLPMLGAPDNGATKGPYDKIDYSGIKKK